LPLPVWEVTIRSHRGHESFLEEALGLDTFIALYRVIADREIADRDIQEMMVTVQPSLLALLQQLLVLDEGIRSE
jgi:hypothetical protein